MDVYLLPLVSSTSLHGNPQAEKSLPCIDMQKKPVGADKNPSN